MNWTRGLVRLWLVASILWAALVGWIAYESAVVPRLAAANQESCFQSRKADSTLGNPFDCFDSGGMSFADLVPRSTDIVTYSAWVLIPPLALLFLGFMIKWVLAGFRP